MRFHNSSHLSSNFSVPLVVNFASNFEIVTVMPLNNRKLNSVRLYSKEVNLSEMSPS